MNKKLLMWMLVYFLLSNFVFAENGESIDWETAGAIQDKPSRFAEEIGIQSISGNLGGVQYSKEAGTITNGGVTLPIKNIKGAQVISLVGGGFEIKKEGEFNVGGNTFEAGTGQSVRFNNDGTYGLPTGSKMITEGRTITSEQGIVVIASNNEELKINGLAILNTEDGRVVKGYNLNIHFSEILPEVRTTQSQVGNHIYLAKNEGFIIRGEGEISHKVSDMENIHKSVHPHTVMWSWDGKDIDISNPAKFDIRTTVGLSWHEVEIKDITTEQTKRVTIQNRYVGKEGNNLHILSKAISLGELGEISNANYEITKTPGVKIDIGDEKPFELNNPDFIMKNVLVSSRINPNYEVSVGNPSKEEVQEGVITELTINQMLAAAKSRMQIDPKTLEQLIDKYKNYYSGPDEERNEDFIAEIVHQKKFKISTDTSVFGGRLIGLLGADAKVRGILKENGKKSGLTGQDWKNYDYIIGKYKVGQTLMFDSTNPDNPSMNIIDDRGRIVHGREISSEGVNKIRSDQIVVLIKDKKLNLQLQELANEFLK